MNRCQCLTLKGTQCSNKAVANSQYCAVHKNCSKSITTTAPIQSTKTVTSIRPTSKQTAIKKKWVLIKVDSDNEADMSYYTATDTSVIMRMLLNKQIDHNIDVDTAISDLINNGDIEKGKYDELLTQYEDGKITRETFLKKMTDEDLDTLWDFYNTSGQGYQEDSAPYETWTSRIEEYSEPVFVDVA